MRRRTNWLTGAGVPPKLFTVSVGTPELLVTEPYFYTTPRMLQCCIHSPTEVYIAYREMAGGNTSLTLLTKSSGSWVKKRAYSYDHSLPTYGLVALGMDSVTPGTIYLYTQEPGPSSSDVRNWVVLKTTNGGTSWSSAVVCNTRVYGLHINELENSNLLSAYDDSRISVITKLYETNDVNHYISTDGGSSFSLTGAITSFSNDPQVFIVKRYPLNPSLAVANIYAFSTIARGVYMNENVEGGGSWVKYLSSPGSYSTLDTGLGDSGCLDYYTGAYPSSNQVIAYKGDRTNWTLGGTIETQPNNNLGKRHQIAGLKNHNGYFACAYKSNGLSYKIVTTMNSGLTWGNLATIPLPVGRDEFWLQRLALSPDGMYGAFVAYDKNIPQIWYWPLTLDPI